MYQRLLLKTCLLLMGCSAAAMGRQIYMDSPTACNQQFTIADEALTVKPRGSVGTANPPSSCMVYLESGYTGANYKFEIVIEAAQFRDCNLELRIFDGPSAGGQYIRMLACGTTTSTGKLYPNGRQVTLMLTRTRDSYFFGNDFTLTIQVYKSTDLIEEIFTTSISTYGPAVTTDGQDENQHSSDESASTFRTHAVIGIACGVLVAVVIVIILSVYCYIKRKASRSSGMGENTWSYTECHRDEANPADNDNTIQQQPQPSAVHIQPSPTGYQYPQGAGYQPPQWQGQQHPGFPPQQPYGQHQPSQPYGYHQPPQPYGEPQPGQYELPPQYTETANPTPSAPPIEKM